MSFLLDTNVVSEWVAARPNPGVVGWLMEADEDRIFLSVVTLAELRRGVERLANGRRRKRLDEWLRDDLPQRFEGRILPVDQRVADAWGLIVAKREDAGRPISVIDAFMVATATVHDLTIVTRNTSDFSPSDASVINPWTT
ncbi:MAG TPA: type II toxin-antitoxin system VapC family toxin [Gemmatimonadaceae bacterium]|nr:type II toxin-antitoxin system VapC family toxin [Gemmatimonadaceae bacterium]